MFMVKKKTINFFFLNRIAVSFEACALVHHNILFFLPLHQPNLDCMKYLMHFNAFFFFYSAY